MKRSCFLVILFFASCSLADAKRAEELTLLEQQRALIAKRFVDLTNTFAPGIPHWPGFPDEKREMIYWFDKGRGSMGAGFFAEIFTHVGQWGTHVDPPAHFLRGGRTVDQISLKEMILPLAVIDVHEEATNNADYTLTVERLKRMGNGSWTNSRGCIRGDADRLVEALARRRENGEQRQQRRFALSRMESGCAEISLRGTQNYCFRSRNDRYGPGDCDDERRLLAGNLHLESRPLSD